MQLSTNRSRDRLVLRVSVRRLLPAVIVVMLTASPARAAGESQSSDTAAGARVAASIAGSQIYETDLDRRWEVQDAAAYLRVQREAYEGRRRALEALLREQLLAREAAEQGIEQEALLEREVRKRTKVVTDADISAFMASNPLPAGATPAMVGPLVTVLLGQRAREAAREEYFMVLQRASINRVEVFLEPPRVALMGESHNPVRGAADAPVHVVVFSDFECPFCRRTEPVLNRLFERFPREVRFVWKNFPLSIHPGAAGAAEAAQCAHDQGRFWDYHDALFAAAVVPDQQGFRAVANGLGLDGVAFDECLQSHRRAAEVKADITAGQRAGVEGTPTVFVNGVAFVGALPFEAYERAVLDELARLQPAQSEPLASGARP